MAIKSYSVITEVKKFWWRIFDKSKYFEYKLYLKDQNILNKFNPQLQKDWDAISQIISKEPLEINFKHSGHLGDLIYALPILKELAKKSKCNLYVNLGQTMGRNYYKHPTGNVMLTERTFEMILPLLKEQLYITNVKRWENEAIDIDLDLFRKLPVAMEFHSIRWYYHLTGLQPNMFLPFLNVEAHKKITDKIVIVRTFRGRNPLIDYSFLNKYSNLLFLGTREEYDDFSKEVPIAEFYNVSDFLEMAQIIKSSRFFVSNQTFSFAIAEGLKVNRLLESNPFSPVVFPLGGNGSDFYFQPQFEKLFSEFYLNFK